jgi:hypothetical protein
MPRIPGNKWLLVTRPALWSCLPYYLLLSFAWRIEILKKYPGTIIHTHSRHTHTHQTHGHHKNTY